MKWLNLTMRLELRGEKFDDRLTIQHQISLDQLRGLGFLPEDFIRETADHLYSQLKNGVELP